MGSLFLFLNRKIEFKRRIRSSRGVGFDGIEGFIVRCRKRRRAGRSRSLLVDDPLRSSPFGSAHHIDIKLTSGEGRTRSSLSMSITVGLCFFFYVRVHGRGVALKG